MPAESKPIKRKRGGQKGNQNARKHGFYSSILNSDEINSLGNLLNQEHIDPEMAVLRVKLQSFIKNSTKYPSACWRDESGLARIWRGGH